MTLSICAVHGLALMRCRSLVCVSNRVRTLLGNFGRVEMPGHEFHRRETLTEIAKQLRQCDGSPF